MAAGENPYQVSGRDVVFDWIAKQTDSADVDVMLAWLPKLAQDPYAWGTQLPRPGVPLLAAATPLDNTMVVYSVIEQYHTIKIIRFDLV